MPSWRLYISAVLLIALLQGCGEERISDWPFEQVDSDHSGITFQNRIEDSDELNIFLYRNFYNGGGVAIADINNDGLADVYLTSNTGSNALYLNKGDFHFEDITSSAGVSSEDKWSTGVAIADLNNDGWLDIYVCNAGARRGGNKRNQLYINNGDLTFTEMAASFGLDEDGYTTHASFFDYDKDGDLDVYILNNSVIQVNSLNYSNKRELPASEWPVADSLRGGGDRLLRNESGKFVDVTRYAGIYNSLIGFGLGITIGDVNDDGWEDIYISNDFFERDYLYINQRDGTFRDEVEERMNHLSSFSMGSDLGDINNDLHADLFVTDMLPSDPVRLKTTTAFEDYHVHQLKRERGFYHQYMHNTLQLNRGDGTFNEVAEYSGLSASDWSWGALMLDVDNDGLKDVYVSNGILRDVTNLDFMDFFANDVLLKGAFNGKKLDVKETIEQIPSVPLRNKLFMNEGGVRFRDMSEDKFNTPSFSNGAAYGDLDNDGDLDLIVNNVNSPAFVLRNNSSGKNNANYIQLALKGSSSNTFAIGAEVFVYAADVKQRLNLMPSRGYQSSVDYKLHVGLGSSTKVDSIIVRWPDLTETLVLSPPPRQLISVDYAASKKRKVASKAAEISSVFTKSDISLQPHREDDFVDFFNEGLIIEMVSREGPKAAVGDINGDRVADLFIAGAKDQSGVVYIRSGNGFIKISQPSIERDSLYEDTACTFFDTDNDGDLDLVVGSGGNLPRSAMPLRLYMNDGKGTFSRHHSAFPIESINTAVIISLDFDNDGDNDLFVGSRSVPGVYGVNPPHYLYENKGQGRFENVISERGPSLQNAGMISDAALADVNADGLPELILVGHWAHPKIFQVKDGNLSQITTGLEGYPGFWSAVHVVDIDSDGDNDLILGNRGENFLLNSASSNGAKMWIYDFDGNNTIEKIITTSIKGRDIPVHSKKDLTQQIGTLKKRNLRHSEFATKSIQDLFDEKVLDKAMVLEAKWFTSSVAINDGTGKFTLNALPSEVQLSSINAIFSTDLNGDGMPDLVLAGNKAGFVPQFSKLDANFGLVLFNKSGTDFKILTPKESGIRVRGDVTQIVDATIDGSLHLIFLVNDNEPQVYMMPDAHPPLRSFF